MIISVILPTYKPAPYIYECLDSINNQTLDKSSYELVLILNGCNEPYKTDIENYISCKISPDLNINFIQTDQGGVSNARNIGIENAKGEYITFIDDDDYISTVYLEELLKNAAQDTVSLSNAIAFDDATGVHDENYHIRKAFREHEITTINKARRYFSGPCMKLIHRDIIGYRRFDVRFKNGEDSLFMFLISDKIEDCKFTSKDAVYYRRNRENSAVSGNKTISYIISNRFRLIGEYCKLYFNQSAKYNNVFFTTRLLAALHTICNHVAKCNVYFS